MVYNMLDNGGFVMPSFDKPIPQEADHEPCGHWHVKPSVPLTGVFYCSYATIGPTYYPAQYSIVEIDVDKMAIARSADGSNRVVAFPTLDSGYALTPTKMALSDTHLYVTCRDLKPHGYQAPYLAIVRRSDMMLVDYYQLPQTVDGAYEIVLNELGNDLGVSVNQDFVILYNLGGGGMSGYDYAVYRKYAIQSDGSLVQVSEVLFEDTVYKEASGVSTTLIAGLNYHMVGMNMESGRLVQLQDSAFARIAVFDNNVDPLDSARCYGICYDVDNGIVYMGLNHDDPITRHCKVVKIDIATMTLLDTLVLCTGDKSMVLQAMSDHPEGGYIYAALHDNVTPFSQTLYEIDIATFTVNRSGPYGGCTNQRNALYPDAERGYVYYCGNGRLNSDYHFYRFNLGSFADDPSIVTVVDDSLHWGINGAQSYGGTV